MKNKKIHFIDCGANIGQTIDWVLETYGDNLLKIDSFEPQEENFNVLKSKYKNNKYSINHIFHLML